MKSHLHLSDVARSTFSWRTQSLRFPFHRSQTMLSFKWWGGYLQWKYFWRTCQRRDIALVLSVHYRRLHCNTLCMKMLRQSCWERFACSARFYLPRRSYQKKKNLSIFCRCSTKAYLQSAKSQGLILYKPPDEFLAVYPQSLYHVWRASIPLYGEVDAGLNWDNTLVKSLVETTLNL